MWNNRRRATTGSRRLSEQCVSSGTRGVQAVKKLSEQELYDRIMALDKTKVAEFLEYVQNLPFSVQNRLLTEFNLDVDLEKRDENLLIITMLSLADGMVLESIKELMGEQVD